MTAAGPWPPLAKITRRIIRHSAALMWVAESSPPQRVGPVAAQHLALDLRQHVVFQPFGRVFGALDDPHHAFEFGHAFGHTVMIDLADKPCGLGRRCIAVAAGCR